MNQPVSSLRCPQCNLLNFASEPFCKRCKINLQETRSAGEANTVNINISFPTGVQPRINTQQNVVGANTPQFAQTPPVDYAPTSEYQLQNQIGFEQWQQANVPVNTRFYPPPPAGYPMQSPTVWRRGGELVVHRYAGALPERCVKCNEYISDYSSGAYIKQKYRWHNPLVYIALLSPLIYVILSLVLSQRVEVDIPLCRRHLDDRKSTGNYLLGGGIAAMIAIFFFGSFGYIGFAFLIFFASLIGLTLGFEYSYKPLQISKIENDYVYLKNANNEYLSGLPNC